LKDRHKAIRIALYNHKGGVGKTTLTANIAVSLADLGKRVLVVDSDPQCNITSYFIEDKVVDKLLDSSDETNGRTMWSALKPIVDAEGDYKLVPPYETLIHGLYILPGDIRLAEFESELNSYWDECFQRKVKGYKGTNSLSSFVNEVARQLKVDYVFYDTGPNIGPLNRVILLDCDYFIVPAACDLFSIRALASLGQTVANWIMDWEIIKTLAPTKSYLMPGRPKFLGYIPQRFKIYGGRITQTSSMYVSLIEKAIHDLAPLNVSGTKLGEVKDFSTLVQFAQQEGVPLSEVTEGSTIAQRDLAKVAFDKIAKSIISKTE
jgi:cellulose biosynthesis protein BcsQ